MPNSVSEFDKRKHGGLWHRFEHDAEQAAGAGIVALPDGIARMALERRVKHAQHLGPRFEPARDC